MELDIITLAIQTALSVKTFTCNDCGETEIESILVVQESVANISDNAFDRNMNSSDGATAGIVIGIVTVASGGGFCLYCFVIRKKKQL